MTPLYTVLMSLAGLALVLAVGGVAVLWPAPAGPRHVKRAPRV
jgi:ABC-type phosphate transport system auxiliary subunit